MRQQYNYRVSVEEINNTGGAMKIKLTDSKSTNEMLRVGDVVRYHGVSRRVQNFGEVVTTGEIGWIESVSVAPVGAPAAGQLFCMMCFPNHGPQSRHISAKQVDVSFIREGK